MLGLLLPPLYSAVGHLLEGGHGEGGHAATWAPSEEQMEDLSPQDTGRNNRHLKPIQSQNGLSPASHILQPDPQFRQVLAERKQGTLQ